MVGGRVDPRPEVGEPVVALTFDDGPSPWTDAILDALAEHGAHATFFVLGGAIRPGPREETLRRMAREGHDVGNHTFGHPRLTTLDPDRLRDEMKRTNAAIEAVVGAAPVYWRAPFFDVDDDVRAAVGELCGREVWYSSMPGDWDLEGHETAERVLAALRPGDIVVLHDGRPDDEPAELSLPTREGTVEAVRLILDELDARGWRAVSVSELLAASPSA